MANGTIAFDTLSTSGQITGTAKSVDTDYVVNGSAKSWLQFNGSTQVETGSFNISGVADGGDGDFDVTYTNNMSALNYSVVSAGGMLNSDASGRISETNPTNTSGYQCTTTNSSGSKADHTGNSNATFGDLA